MKITKKSLCSVAAVIGLVTGGTTLYGDEFVQPVGQVVIEGQQLGELRVTPKGLDLIGNAEGCRLEPYRCPAGLKTNGIGNTTGVPNQAVTHEQVAKDWVKNIKESERCVIAAESVSGKRMTNGQFDALTSFVFNFGCTKFLRNKDGSFTRVYAAIREGNYHKACSHIPEWVKNQGVVLPGLVNRRNKEYVRCMEVD